jgi:anti-sigma factor RsiW
MAMTPNERAELEPLLPWHAAGTLSPADAARVEAALAADPELARHFALVREEMSETVRLNEALGVPSARTRDALMAAIDAEARRYPRAAAGAWLARLLASLSPRSLAWAGGVAALVIVVESGLLATLLVGERGASYETASVPPAAQPSTTQESASVARSAQRGITLEPAPAPLAAQAGSHVLVRFTSSATASEITQFLDANKASVVDGPKPGGLYRLRVAADGKDEFARIVASMRGSKLVGFVGPEESR